MAHREPFEQLTGPVTVYVALWTDALEIPEVDTAPTAPWAELGDTDGEQSVQHQGALTYFRDNTYQGPSYLDPHLIFSTVDNGATLLEKAGAHADQADGGGDSIPYLATVALNGVVVYKS